MYSIDEPDPAIGEGRPAEVDACSCGCGAENGEPCADRPTDPAPEPEGDLPGPKLKVA